MSKPEDAARNRSDVGTRVDMQQSGWQPIFGKRNKTILTRFDWFALDIFEIERLKEFGGEVLVTAEVALDACLW
jgi:hypothetical protein